MQKDVQPLLTNPPQQVFQVPVQYPQLQQPIQFVPQPVPQQTVAPIQQPLDYQQLYLKEQENNSLLLFVLGFLCVWVWLIGAIKYNSSPSVGAKRYAKYSKIAFILSLVIGAIAVVLFVGFNSFVYARIH